MALRPLVGVGWMILLVLPWFIAIYLRVGTGFLTSSVGEDMLAKLTSGQEAHGAPPGLYFVLFFATFWPASMLAGLAAPAVWNVRREPAAKFLLAWLVPSWIVFELVVTKLPHYVLPLYPAIAILIAGALETRVLSQRKWLVRGTIWWFLVPALASIAVVVAAVMIARQLGLAGWPFLAVATVFGLLAWQLYDVDGAERSFLRATAASILLAIGTYAVIVPSLSALFPSVTLANAMRTPDCARPVAASAGYEEPSLVFLAGTATRLVEATRAADFLREGGCHFAFIDARQERSFALRAEAIGLRYERGVRLDAFNVSAGRPVTIAVFRSRAAP
jgi:4-amino-4-deoxy-L-arabinose transferase-like glycosyltransferase